MGLCIGVERETVVKVDASVSIARQLVDATTHGNEPLPVAERGIHPCLFGAKCLRASRPSIYTLLVIACTYHVSGAMVYRSA